MATTLRPVCAEAPIPIVAAENFYGDIAQQIGGPWVAVTTILNNPDQDPHLFETSPSVARAIGAARLVIYNGADYDPWMPKQLRAAGADSRDIIDVASLIGAKSGDNPHVWYDPATMPALAAALAAELKKLDPAHGADFDKRLDAFRRSLAANEAKIAALRQRLADTPVAATEPVFGYLLSALGLIVTDPRFELAVMNNTEPGASDIAAVEDDLHSHRAKMLIYNRQAPDPVVQRIVDIAREAQIPVVGVTETEPPGTTFQQWIAGELDAIQHALPPGNRR